MKLDHMELRRNEHIFIIAFCIFILKNLFPISTLIYYPDLLDKVMILLFFVCIGYKLITQKYSPYTLLLLMFCTLLFAYTALSTQYYSIFYGFLCVIAMQNVKLENLLKASLVIKIVFLFIHVCVYFSIFYLYPDTIVLIERNDVYRHFFYLQHPNLFSAILVWTCMEYIYLKYDRIKFNTLLIIVLINMFFYFYTNTNTGLIVIVFSVILILFERRKGDAFQPFLRQCAKFIFPTLAGVFILLVAMYTKLSGVAYTLWHELDKALTGRLLYGAYAFDQYGYSLNGRNITFPEKSYWGGFWLDNIYFDNSYLYLFITYGSFYLIFISAAVYLIERHMEPKEKIMMIALAIFGVMEGYVLNISLCFPLIIIGKYIYDLKFKNIRRGYILYEEKN